VGRKCRWEGKGKEGRGRRRGGEGEEEIVGRRTKVVRRGYRE